MPKIIEIVGRLGSIVSLFLSVVSFFIGLGLGLPVAISIAIAVITGLVLSTLFYIDYRYNLHRRIVGPLRRRILYSLTSIVINTWVVNVQIHQVGDANFKHRIKGKVNFGLNKWVPIRVRADSTQEDIEMKARNCENGRDLQVETKLDCAKYKICRIYFDRTLKRNDTFDIEVEYTLRNTFFFGRTDYYEHRANHYEKRVIISIEFPENIEVMRVWDEIVTEHGDVWGEHEPAQIPGPHKITWDIGKAYYGNHHKLQWMTRIVEPLKSKS